MALTTETGPLKVLVVDDSDYARKGIIEILEKNGYKVIGEANSAEKAAAIYRNTPCDIVILDIVMPEASGFELAKFIQEDKRKKAGIIMISSLRMESIIIEAISNGAMDFLEKPFSPIDFINSVRKVEQELRKSAA